MLEKSHPGRISSCISRTLAQKGQVSDEQGQVPNTCTGMYAGKGRQLHVSNPGQFQSLFLLHVAVFRLCFLLKPMNSPFSWTPITLNLLPQPPPLINTRNTTQVRELCATKIALPLPSWYFWVINTFLEAEGVHQWVFVKCRSEAAIWQSASDTLLRGHFIFQATMSLI